MLKITAEPGMYISPEGMAKLNRELPKLLKRVFGESGAAASIEIPVLSYSADARQRADATFRRHGRKREGRA